MAAKFYEASEELKEIARELIEKNHSHLVEADIKYLFRTGNWEVKKRETWGQAKKVGKEVNFLTGHDFLVIIHRDVWEQLNVQEKKALLDHELQHCSAGTDDAGNKIWYIQGHDVEDFYAIIRRHGLWSKSLRKMKNLLNQTELEFSSDAPESSEKEDIPALNAGEPEPGQIEGRKLFALAAPAKEATDEEAEAQTDFIEAEYTVIEPDDITHLGDTGTEG